MRRIVIVVLAILLTGCSSSKQGESLPTGAATFSVNPSGPDPRARHDVVIFLCGSADRVTPCTSAATATQIAAIRAHLTSDYSEVRAFGYLDPAGALTLARAEKVTGVELLRPGDLPGEFFVDLVHPDNTAVFADRYDPLPGVRLLRCWKRAANARDGEC